MQSTSPVWKGLFASGAALQARATVGGTVYTDIGVPVINRATMQDRLAVGNVVSASLALALRSAGSVPRSAAVVIEVRLNDGQTASEWLPQGAFYISRRMRDPVTGLLALECYDALLKANALWTPSAGAWPRTLAAVTAELAALLGVTLDSRTAIPTGAAYAMSEPAEGTTIRDALSLVAQAAGGNWIITPAGKLRLVRLGEAGDTVDVAGVVGGIDVGQAGTITGVRSTVDGVATLTGDDTGLVVDVTLAPVIAVELAEGLIGQRWQPFRLSGAIYDPAAELGDAIRAGAGGEVASALCSEQAAYGPAFRGDIAAPDPGEVTDEYPYISRADRTLALAKEAVTEAVGRLDDALTQQEIFNRLTDNGAAQGMVLYDGQLYINASYIVAGMLNARYINFNAPVDDFSIPHENDPDSLLDGQTVVDGWIVNESGSLAITALNCRYAKLLRGRTITLTFTYSGYLSACSWYVRNEDDSGEEGHSIPVSSRNPFTWSFTVPNNAQSFYLVMTCSGLKQISATVSGPQIVYPDDIAFTYAGLQVGNFLVDRSGNIDAGGKSVFKGSAQFKGNVTFANPANVRTNLGVTPENIGAVPLAGTGSSPMTGNLDITRANANANIRIKTEASGITLWLYNPIGGRHGLYSDGYYDGTDFHSSGIYMISRETDGKVKVRDHYSGAEIDNKIGTFTAPNGAVLAIDMSSGLITDNTAKSNIDTMFAGLTSGFSVRLGRFGSSGTFTMLIGKHGSNNGFVKCIGNGDTEYTWIKAGANNWTCRKITTTSA